MFMNYRAAIFGGLLLALSQPATCSLFSGPNQGLGTGFYQYGFQHNWDLSGLSVVDTPDGMKITGVMTANITDPDPLGEVSGVNFTAIRRMEDGTDLDLTVLAAQTGTLSYTGNINITQIQTVAYVNGVGCAAYAYNDTGGNLNTSLSQGAFSAGPSETPCLMTLSGGAGLLGVNTTINYVVNGAGTISINFGNSVLGEVRLNVDGEVPEPSTLWLLSAIIPVALYRRRYQPISRIRS